MSVLSDRMCRAHKRRKPCQSCANASETQKRRWTTEARYAAHMRAMAERDDAYCDEEIAVVRMYAGHMAAVDIAKEVSKIRAGYGLPPRTRGSVHAWAERNGISLMMDSPRAVDEVRTLFGVSPVTLGVWRERGWLLGRPWGKFWVYDTAELHQFVVNYPWLLEGQHMAVGPLRTTFTMINQRDPWVKARDLCTLVPIRIDTLIVYMRRGLVPYHQRTGHNGAYMVQASSIPLIRDLLAIGNTHRQKMIKAA